jgi:hypothetical protein
MDFGKSISWASSGVSTTGQRLIRKLVLRNLSGCRAAKRMLVMSTPAGGTEATSTAPGAGCVSRYFWTMKPPIEWPITTGGDSMAAAAAATSWT